MQFSLSRISSALGLALLFAVPSIQPVAAQQFNSLVKGSGPAVYFFAADGKRYAFPNAAVYQSWYPMGANITLLNADQLASMPLGGNVTFKPGVALVKVTTDPKVYAIGKGGVLRWIGSEELARSLYGMDWAKKVSDVADVFFVNYKLGAPILSVNDFDKNVEAGLVSNPGDNIAGVPSSMPVSQLPVTPSTPAVGSAEVAVRLSSSQATLNQTVTINASVTMYSAPIEKIEIYRESSSQVMATCLKTTECGAQYLIQAAPAQEKFYAVATNVNGETFTSEIHARLTVASMSNNLQITVAPQTSSVGSRVSFTAQVTSNNMPVTSHKVFARIPGVADPVLWKDCKTDMVCAGSTPFYRTTSLFSELVSEGLTYISPDATVAVIGGEAPKPKLTIVDRPSKNQVTFKIEAPSGEGILATSLTNGGIEQGQALALCDGTCTVTLQINLPSDIAAYTLVGGKFEVSETFEVKPE